MISDDLDGPSIDLGRAYGQQITRRSHASLSHHISITSPWRCSEPDQDHTLQWLLQRVA